MQNLVAKLGENAKDHKAYNEAFDAATKWLADMEERIYACNDTAGDWHTLQDRMDAVKVIKLCLVSLLMTDVEDFTSIYYVNLVLR